MIFITLALIAVQAIAQFPSPPQPTDADIAYVAALTCGESCGMPRECMTFIATQLRYDWERVGSADLHKRWYAPPKESDLALEIAYEVFDEDYRWPRCRLIGSGSDAIYWRDNGYVGLDEAPDYEWSASGMTVVAFGCGE